MTSQFLKDGIGQGRRGEHTTQDLASKIFGSK